MTYIFNNITLIIVNITSNTIQLNLLLKGKKATLSSTNRWETEKPLKYTCKMHLALIIKKMIEKCLEIVFSVIHEYYSGKLFRKTVRYNKKVKIEK